MRFHSFTFFTFGRLLGKSKKNRRETRRRLRRSILIHVHTHIHIYNMCIHTACSCTCAQTHTRARTYSHIRIYRLVARRSRACPRARKNIIGDIVNYTEMRAGARRCECGLRIRLEFALILESGCTGRREEEKRTKDREREARITINP